MRLILNYLCWGIVCFLILWINADPLYAQVSASKMETLKNLKLEWRGLTAQFKCYQQDPPFAARKDCDPATNDGIGKAGDAILFNALLCYSGEDFGCRAVKASQDQNNGRWTRSPLHVNKPTIQDSGSFSKDQAVGVFLYLLEKKDKTAASKWLTWIEGRPSTMDTVLVVADQFRDQLKLFQR